MSRVMNDSGVEWIGKIPEEWNLIQLSSAFSERKNKNIGLMEQNLLSLSYGRVIRKDINTNEGLLPESFENYNVLKQGDIVFRLTDLQNDKKSWRTGLCLESGIITSAYVTIKPMIDLDSFYMHLLFHSYDICKVFYGMGGGVRQGLNYAELKKLMVLFPPIDDQHRIAEFVGNATKKIDRLISLQEEMITELQAYKQSVITEAVTKGLDPNVPMKDSGVEWIGMIPDKWRINKFRRIIKSTANGITRRGIFTESGNIVLKLKNIDSGSSSINYADINRFLLSPDELSQYQLHDDDLLFVRVNGSKDLVGKVAIYKDIGESVAYNDHIIKVQLHKGYDVRYILYYLVSLVGRTEIGLSIKTSAGQYTISGDDIRSMQLILIPKSEQIMIVKYLDKQCAKIDHLISIKQSKIDTLKEYKKSLIYECVTGKRNCGARGEEKDAGYTGKAV